MADKADMKRLLPFLVAILAILSLTQDKIKAVMFMVFYEWSKATESKKIKKQILDSFVFDERAETLTVAK